MRFSTLLLLLIPGCIEYDMEVFDTVDVFAQDPAAEVDALLVVDDSYSMAPFQERLSQNFSEFVSYFVDLGVDYHVGVVTTSVVEPAVSPTHGCTAEDVALVPDPGALVDGTIITTATDSPDQLFADLVSVGVCGSGMEMGIEAAYLALTERISDGSNTGFLREDAFLSLVFVSDEEDSSPLPIGDYVDAFREIKGQRSRDVFNASALFVSDLASCTAEQQSEASVSQRYPDIAEQTGGLTGDICSEDFSAIITELSANASRLLDTFYLSEPPNPGTLQVSVDDEVLACEDGAWTYTLLDEAGEERPAIVFAEGSVPPPSAHIVARYYWGGGDPEGFCAGLGADDTGGER